MATREKIIVGIMCLTIVYGAYDLLVARKSTRTTPPPAGNAIGELRLFVAEVGQKLNSQRIANDYPYMINQAGATWDKDPFIQSSKPLQKRLTLDSSDRQSQPKEQSPAFRYSGYMQSGTIKMAIIDGMEYVEGESLADKTFYVKSISPQRVVIGKVKGLETIQLPISEIDSGLGE